VVAPSAAGPSRPPTRQRIIEATYACVAQWGLAKTTVEDAARAAGVSRATVYRQFPGGRDELLDAVVLWEFLQFFVRLYEEVHDAASLPEVLERALAFAHRAVVEHEVLQRLLVTEPDVLLPKLTTEVERVVSMVAGFLLPYLARHRVAEGVDLHEAADYLARMTLSHIGAPGSWDLSDPAQVADLVRVEFLAGIVDEP
jgi:AcrR family transcriptional regulator